MKQRKEKKKKRKNRKSFDQIIVGRVYVSKHPFSLVFPPNKTGVFGIAFYLSF